MIESIKNEKIKRLIQLENKKYRDNTNCFIVEGIKMVDEVPCEFNIDEIFVSNSFAKNNIDLLNIYEKLANINVVEEKVFANISQTENSQGIIAICEKKSINIDDFFKSKKSFLILVEEIQDPGNLGTIIRTADAAGVDGILLSKNTVDLYNPKVVRSTMSSIFHIPIVCNVDINEIIPKLKQEKFDVLAAHLKGEYYYNTNMKKNVCIMIGNESKGLKLETSQMANKLVKIPMLGKAESLNAGIAAGVLIYEVVRQRMIGN